MKANNYLESLQMGILKKSQHKLMPVRYGVLRGIADGGVLE